VNCFVKAYNFQDYDGYFVQQYLHQNGVVPEVIMGGGGGGGGAKILSLNI
jgi:hypothetical protein